VASRKILDKARRIAAHLLEVAAEDLVYEPGKFSVKGSPNRSKTIQDVAFAAYTNHPQGMEAGLEAVSYYDPPNLTYPFGSYICVVDIDKGTGEVEGPPLPRHRRLREHHQSHIVQGQVHGGLTMGLAPAALRGDLLRRVRQCPGRQLHRLSRSHAVETPKWETGHTVTRRRTPAGRQGCGRVARWAPPRPSPTAVVDALWQSSASATWHPDHGRPKVWKLLREKGVTE